MGLSTDFDTAAVKRAVWPPHYMQEDQPLVVDAFGDFRTITDLDGDVLVNLTRDRLAQDEDQHRTRPQIGEGTDEKPIEPDTSAYNITHKYQESFDLIDQKRAMYESFPGIDDGVDLAQYIGRSIRYQIWYDYSQDVNDLITDTSLNAEEAVGNAWDSGSQTIPTDIENGIDKIAGQAQIAVMGVDVLRDLQADDSVQQRAGVSITASDGRASPAAVEDFLTGILGVDEVYVGDQLWSNTNNYAQGGLSAKRLFDGTMWIGSEEAIINLEQENNEPEAESHRPPKEGREVWTGTQTWEPHRVTDEELGVVFTGI